MTFLYVEQCTVNRQDGAITIRDDRGTAFVPAAAISVLMLGPGTSITHRAMELIGDAGVGAVWVGENGVRFYAEGRPLTHSSTMLIRQAELVSNTRRHLDVVRKMYGMRFPGEDVSKLTMQQLRGREGARVRAAYRSASKEWNVPWNGRNYEVDDYEGGDRVNQALSAGCACLYGLAHSVICALGLSPGLGFVHVGHERSFVYDIADLYKAELVIPKAFEIAASSEEDVGGCTRRSIRDEMFKCKLIERMVDDIKALLNEDEDENSGEAEVIYLWDDKKAVVSYGISYRYHDGIRGGSEDAE